MGLVIVHLTYVTTCISWGNDPYGVIGFGKERWASERGLESLTAHRVSGGCFYVSRSMTMRVGDYVAFSNLGVLVYTPLLRSQSSRGFGRYERGFFRFPRGHLQRLISGLLALSGSDQRQRVSRYRLKTSGPDPVGSEILFLGGGD